MFFHKQGLGAGNNGGGVKRLRRTGRQASVRADSSGLVMNISTTPKMDTTMLRSAMDIEIVPALFIRRVSCWIKSFTFSTTAPATEIY